MMEKSRITRTVYLAIMVGAMIFTACGRTPPAKFYSLQPVEIASPVGSMPPNVALAVGPVAIPADLDRTEIVTRDAGNRVSISQFHRWAGPLQPSIASVMAQNIGNLLNTERVTPFTRENIFQPTHRVVVNINRYDSQPSKKFLLNVTWSIKELKGSKLLLVRNSTILESLASSTYEDLVAAQSKALAALSREIAAALLEGVP